MKRYIAVLGLDDGEEIIDASMSYVYRSNGTNYSTTESVELKEESEGQRMKTYEDGLNEAWKAARRIFDPVDKGGLSVEEINQIFFNNNPRAPHNVFDNYSVLEAITKIKEYEEEQKVKIGDEVTDNDGWTGVVTWISSDGEYIVIMQKDGSALHWKKESFKKTGHHFPQIEEVLKRMQEDEA